MKEHSALIGARSKIEATVKLSLKSPVSYSVSEVCNVLT